MLFKSPIFADLPFVSVYMDGIGLHTYVPQTKLPEAKFEAPAPTVQNFNEHSADDGRDVLRHYVDLTEAHEDDKHTVFRSLIVDVAHSADRNGVDFAQAVDEANMIYHEEVRLYGEVERREPAPTLDEVVEALRVAHEDDLTEINEELAEISEEAKVLSERVDELRAYRHKLNEKLAADVSTAIGVFQGAESKDSCGCGFHG